MKIAIAGTGYVGLSNGVLLSQHHKVVALDIVAEKGEALNRKKSPIHDEEIELFFKTRSLNFRATLDPMRPTQALTLWSSPHRRTMIRSPTRSTRPL